MGENDKPEEVLTIPKLKLRNDYPTPDALKVWDNKDQITPEYRAMMDTINTMIDNIAVSLNEGPELADSVGKRVQSLDAIVKSLLNKVFISLYDRIAILNKIEYELLNDHTMRKMAAQYAQALQAQAEADKKKADNYVQ